MDAAKWNTAPEGTDAVLVIPAIRLATVAVWSPSVRLVNSPVGAFTFSEASTVPTLLRVLLLGL